MSARPSQTGGPMRTDLCCAVALSVLAVSTTARADTWRERFEVGLAPELTLVGLAGGARAQVAWLPTTIDRREQKYYGKLTWQASPRDIVNMPRPELFTSGEEYYATLFHELGHATGHASRLDRRTLRENRGMFASNAPSKSTWAKTANPPSAAISSRH